MISHVPRITERAAFRPALTNPIFTQYYYTAVTFPSLPSESWELNLQSHDAWQLVVWTKVLVDWTFEASAVLKPVLRLQCCFNYTQHRLEFWKASGITSTDGDLCHGWRGLHCSWSYMVLVTLVVGLLWPTQSDYGLGRRLILGGIAVVLCGGKIIHIQSKSQFQWVKKVGFLLWKHQTYVVEIHRYLMYESSLFCCLNHKTYLLKCMWLSY